MDIPYEILKYIFSFQDKWWILKNKIINIAKLYQLPRPKPTIYPVLCSVQLKVSPTKNYFLDYWSVSNIFMIFFIDGIENSIRTSLNHIYWTKADNLIN